MRIGVLTFHNAVNYGAILQAYATQELLKSMGHTVQIIDYHNPKIDAYYKKYEFSLKKILTWNPKRLIKSIIIPFLYKKRKLRYAEFLKFLNMSAPTKEGESLSRYDAILIGSDQVWSIKHTGGFDAMYWGDFTVLNGTKKIAWSVCMGEIDGNSNDSIIAGKLQNFTSISVRETYLKDYLKAISNREVTVTFDPTLVADKIIWDSFLHSVKEKDYILVYAVDCLQETIQIATEYAHIMKKKVIIISAYSGRPIGVNVKQSCGPQDFMSYIKSASMVVTSSFHGTVFSILFEKEFVSVIPKGKSNTRIRTLLETLKMTNRIVEHPNDLGTFSRIDYCHVNESIKRNKEKSIDFLKNALS